MLSSKNYKMYNRYNITYENDLLLLLLLFYLNNLIFIKY